MIIDKVTINNFYCFLGENVLEFSKGLNIISAHNRGGKSQLFNAFYWTFFEKIYTDENPENNTGKKVWKPASGLVVIPYKLKEESRKGDRISSSVEIVLTAEYHLNDEPRGELIEYTFSKSVTYEKSGSHLIIISKPELTISFVRGGETEYIGSHQHSWFLEKIFPSSIRKFMWYQGETMDELYDFSNPSTLKNAIKEISYFPMYDNMERIVKASFKSINKKIQTDLSKRNQLSAQQQKLINDINAAATNIDVKETQIEDLSKEVEKIQDDIATQEHKLLGYDKYRDLKEQLVQLESERNIVKNKIEDADIYIKETLINKWMLNGCEDLIRASEANLNILNEEVKQYNNTTNPVPISLPGPEYVEKMLADKTCYICEREVEEDTPPYEALKKRLVDFENHSNHKVLQENYIELNKSKRRILAELPPIKDEIEANTLTRKKLIDKLNRLTKQIKAINDNSGSEDGTSIYTGASTYAQMFSKVQSLRSSLDTKKSSLNYIINNLDSLKEEYNRAIQERDKNLKNVKTDSFESQAEEYISMFVSSVGKLRSIAYTKLINEIQEESNRLYSLYLGGNAQGVILIDAGIRIVDKDTREIMTDLNTAEVVAQKLAVANAFLSLSEKKMKRPYPIVADAPTSDLDAGNTYTLTLNIGNSFDQMIIMSKDYSSFNQQERTNLIRDAKIQKFYEFKNEKIEVGGSDSRTNKKTFITTIK